MKNGLSCSGSLLFSLPAPSRITFLLHILPDCCPVPWDRVDLCPLGRPFRALCISAAVLTLYCHLLVHITLLSLCSGFLKGKSSFVRCMLTNKPSPLTSAPALWGTSASGSEMLLQMSWRGPVQLHSEGVSLKRGSKEWYLQVQGGARSSYREDQVLRSEKYGRF